MSRTDPLIIDTPELLNDACRLIARSPWAAVDTEADSLHHYIEKLCLVQVSIPEQDMIIDPLASLDLKPLVELLNQKSLILHGADFDIRILKRFYAFEPHEIFDTMIAAQLLGYEKQGLADLAEKHCGVVLSKSAQKADWSVRPLNEKLLLYAANDTHYLKAIHDTLERELASLNRLAWHEQACEKLLKNILAAKEDKSDNRPAWQVKGSKELKGNALTVLKSLWEWREAEARRRDRPSFKIIASETLVDIARWSQDHPAGDIASWPAAPRNVKGEYREALNRVLKEAQALPAEAFVPRKSGARPEKSSAASQKKVLLLKKERERIGSDLKIQPSLLATNAVLEMLALHSPHTRQDLEKLGLLLPWQSDILAESFLKVLGNPEQFGIIKPNEPR